MENNLPKRKPTRLKEYDYSSPSAYFITICVKDRKELLSQIIVGQGLAPAENRLTPYGNIAKEQIESLENRYNGIKIDKYVIMPNHIHILISNYEAAGASPCPTISDVICTFKSLTTRACKKAGFVEQHLFQRSFHDQIIRDKNDYQKIWEYIDTNVLKWEQDCFYNKKRITGYCLLFFFINPPRGAYLIFHVSDFLYYL